NVRWYTSDCGAGDTNPVPPGLRNAELRPFRFCPPLRFGLWLEMKTKKRPKRPGDVTTDVWRPMSITMTGAVERERTAELKKSSWWWPGVVATSLAGAAVVQLDCMAT